MELFVAKEMGGPISCYVKIGFFVGRKSLRGEFVYQAGGLGETAVDMHDLRPTCSHHSREPG
jgi:hypothetical protein